MDDQRTVILCSENAFFQSTLVPIIDDVCWRAVTVSTDAALDDELRAAPAGSALVAIDLTQPGSDPMATLKQLADLGGSRPPVIALRGSDEAPELLATLKRAGVIWFFDTNAAKHEILFALKSLFNPQVTERRRHPRAPVEAPVIYWSGNDPHREGTIRDISEGGMFIQCDERYILGAVIQVRFNIGGQATLEVQGEVVFTSPRMERQSALASGLGVKFRDVSPEALAALQDYIERVLERMPDTYNKRLLGLKEV